MQDELLDETEMVPYADGKVSWPSPPPATHERYLEHIETIPQESPLFFGMHLEFPLILLEGLAVS